jgi:nicotinate-nucleotide adenylyltransferase
VSDRVAARIGVFGSLCNPPHLGHRMLILEAAWQLGLDRVLLVPTARPGHRDEPPEPFAVRARMAEALVVADPNVSVSTIEAERPGPSYTTDTLRALRLAHPGAELHLLIGGDQLAALGRWHEADQLPQLARIAVAARPGFDVDDDPRVTGWITMPAIGISSSEVRSRVAAGQPFRHLVGDAVASVIEDAGLYRS